MSKPKLSIVKIGGNVVNNADSLNMFLKRFNEIPSPKILVHGGGREATTLAGALDIETKMIEGRRVTDRATLDIVTMVYAGLINKRIVSALQAEGCDAIGLSGADGDMLKAVRRQPEPIDYGFVGDVDACGVNVEFLRMLVKQDYTPVVCAITHDGSGQLLNTNADSVATALAKGLSECFEVSLTFCFEMPGVMTDINDEKSVIEVITRDVFNRLVEEKQISGGMIPKISNALDAVDFGVSEVVITEFGSVCARGKGTRVVG